jgi:prepilin-type N-terminal cleavage/methylation domain-containing protein
MRRRLGNAQTGFTLIELLIVIAIIGILAAMLIPNLLDALQKAKQKKTVADMRIAGTAMFSWLSDQVGAAAAGGAVTALDLSDYDEIDTADLKTLLVPLYIESLQDLDGWKRPYTFYCDVADPHSRHVLGIASGGRDGTSAGPTYTVGGFDPTDYDQDIVWTDGFFARWPQK